MIELVLNNDVLEKCIKDILSQIKPAEDDLNKRLSAIKELEVSMQPVAALRGNLLLLWLPWEPYPLFENESDIDSEVCALCCTLHTTEGKAISFCPCTFDINF